MPPESVRHDLCPVFGGEPERVRFLSLSERHAELVGVPLNRRDGDDVRPRPLVRRLARRWVECGDGGRAEGEHALVLSLPRVL